MRVINPVRHKILSKRLEKETEQNSKKTLGKSISALKKHFFVKKIIDWLVSLKIGPPKQRRNYPEIAH